MRVVYSDKNFEIGLSSSELNLEKAIGRVISEDESNNDQFKDTLFNLIYSDQTSFKEDISNKEEKHSNLSLSLNEYDQNQLRSSSHYSLDVGGYSFNFSIRDWWEVLYNPIL